MLKAPKVPLPYRLAALALAIGLGVFSGEFYILGRKFAGAITNYAKLAAEQDKPPPRPAEYKNEPGVVPVMILKSDRKN